MRHLISWGPQVNVTADNPAARLASLAIGLGTLALFALPGTAQSAFPGANGKIAFTADSGGYYQIFSMDPDGSDQTRLTNDQVNDVEPAWSPDGKRIAFASERDGNQEIYVMNADGSGQTRLTMDPAFDDSPAWSPDGQKIVYSSNRDGDLEIYVMNADGSGRTRLTTNAAADSEPVWSPSGQKIAFTSNRAGYDEIYVMNVDGSGQTLLTSLSSYKPAWSPDGKKLASLVTTSDGTSIDVMNVDGSGQTLLTTDPALIGSKPAWSPDGRQIAFAGFDWRDGTTEIYVMNADGSGQIRLTNRNLYNFAPDWQPLTGPTLSAAVQQPINADGTSVFSSKRGVVPIKFALSADGTPTCALPSATIAVTRTSGAVIGAIDESVYGSAADTGSGFRVDSCQYVYNLSTSALGMGSYRVDILIDGRVVGSATFQLK